MVRMSSWIFTIAFVLSMLVVEATGKEMWFKQFTCSDRTECIGCKATEFAQNVCLPAAGGGGANATCLFGSIYIMYYASEKCVGAYTTQVSTVGTCLTASDGTRFFFECPDPFAARGSLRAHADALVLRPSEASAAVKGNFTQHSCDDPNCMTDCRRNVFPENTCLQTTVRGSAIAICDTASGENQIIFYVFRTSDCTGSFTVELSYLDTCLFGQNSRIMYTCPAARDRRSKVEDSQNIKAPIELRSFV